MIYERAITLLSGRYGGRAAPQAYLEFAQEHFLAWMATEGLFAGDHPLIFKGGTALRKFRFGLAGRFSTDLDFAAESTDYPEHVLDSLDEGFSFEGVTFHLTDLDRPALKGTWRAQAEGIAGETIDAKLDFSPRPTLYPPERRPRSDIAGVERRFLGFDPVDPPLMTLLENVSEKLARFRRQIIGRDLYDIARLAPELRPHLPALREAVLFKVFFDLVEDGQAGAKPFRAGPEYAGRTAAQVIGFEDLGVLSGLPQECSALLAVIGSTYGAMGEPTGAVEIRLGQASRSDLFWAQQIYASRRAELRARPQD
jgi:predicted nucleotidyltransferase component of viral defense system